jgi:hypothetical protein
MKESKKQVQLFIIGIVCLPFAVYKFYSSDNIDFENLVGLILSVWLIYDYYIYKTSKPHILNSLKECFMNKDSEDEVI